MGEYKVAVATSDGIVVNQHFGRADTFYVYEIEESGSIQLLERRFLSPVCDGGNHNEERLAANLAKLADCKYLLVSRIGAGAASVAEQAGIIPMELPDMIEESLNKIIKYEQIQKLITGGME